MFSKLRQQRFTNKKSPTPKPSPPKSSHSPISRERSYSRLQKQKHNNSQLFDYEIAWICDHLYQGCFQNNYKHGQGILILSNGIVLVGYWKKGVVDGYGLFLTPFGGKVHVVYKEGVIDGWVICQYRDNFMIVRFNNDVPDPVRLRYDESEQTWTQAIYTTGNKLQKILSITHSPNYELPAHITDQPLLKMYTQLIMQCKTKIKRTKLNLIKINDKFQYYGYTNQQQTPHGLGIIYSSNQIYAGNFKNGALDQYGMILFQNGVMYKGEIYGGKIWGDGILYDINLDQSKIVRVCQEGVQYVVDQEDGFAIQSIPFNIGKIPKMPQERGFSAAIQPLFEQITKYYYRSNSTIIEESEPQNSISAIEQDHSSVESEQPETRLQKRKRLNQTKIIISPPSKPSQATPSPQTKPKPIPQPTPPVVQQPYATQSESQIQSKKSSTHNRLPSFAPSYDQISRSGLTKTKPQYPYLMQFQMSKNIFSPYKFNKIGKIVANSVKIAEKYM